MTHDQLARTIVLLDMPTVESQFPIVFKNQAQWTKFEGYCYKCGDELEPHRLRGEVLTHTEHMVSVEAVGFCVKCQVISSYAYRMYDDMRFTGQKDGKWQTWTAKPENPSTLRKVLKLLFW